MAADNHRMLYLMRHGHAVPGQGIPDGARHLDERGRAEARSIGKKLLSQALELDAIVCSPLVRAVQTAELVAGELGWSKPIFVLLELEPDNAPKKASQALGEFGRVLAVSHEPLVSELSALLGWAGPGFHTGQVVHLADGQRVWSLVP